MYELALALKELERIELRERFSGASGLYEFVKYFWRTVEPSTDFVDGWVVRTICEHLQAVHEGRITRLLMNVPPGSSKSLLTNVFYPAWAWSAGGKAGLRFVSFSYGSYLTERDNERMLIVIKSPEFQDLYGKTFKLTAEGKVKVSNDARGWKFASSVGGVGTGERGDVILCFPYDSKVATEHGYVKIGDIVKEKKNVKVWSRNIETGLNELRPVIGWKHNPSSELLKIELSNGGSITCTPDHKIWTSRGWLTARELGTTAGRVIIPASNEPSYGVTQMLPCLTASDSGNRGNANFKLSGKFSSELSKWSVINFTRNIISNVRSSVTKSSISFAICDVLRTSTIFKIRKSAIFSNVVSMSNLLTFRAGANKTQHYKLVSKFINKLTILCKCVSRVSFIKRRLHNSTLYSKDFTACTHDGSRETADSTKVRHFVTPFKSGNSEPCFVVSVKRDRHVMETFCLTVEGNHNMFVGNDQELYLVSNCDDPHKVNESQEVIDTTVTWVRETMANRLNSMTTGAIICIMQRVNEGDVSGFYLTSGENFVHLLVPMEYEADRAVSTSIGWSDPRTREGECYWPERFPREAVERCKAQGPYAWASQYQQRPEVRGGGIIKREYWKLWPGRQWPKQIDYIVASLDPAFTKLTMNDPSGFTIWGVFEHGAILMYAWRKWLEIHGPELERMPGETDTQHRERSRPFWGLVETVADDCRRFKVDLLLIEAKASGHSVAQEMARLYPGECSVNLVDPKGLDKVARALRVQPEFSNGQIWRPDTKFAQLAVDEAAVFPRGRYDDITDSMTQALWNLRQRGFMQRPTEKRRAQDIEASNYSIPPPLYDV